MSLTRHECGGKRVADEKKPTPGETLGGCLILVIGLIVVLGLIGFAINSCSGNKSNPSADNTASNSEQPAPAPPPTPSPAEAMKQAHPADEVAFINAVDQGKAAAKQAANDMAKGGTRVTRKAAICAALPSRDIADWTGKITELSSNSEGKGSTGD